MIGLVVFLLVVTGGCLAVAWALRGTLEEAARLRDEVRLLGDLQPALVAVRHEAAATADAVKRMRSK